MAEPTNGQGAGAPHPIHSSPIQSPVVEADVSPVDASQADQVRAPARAWASGPEAERLAEGAESAMRSGGGDVGRAAPMGMVARKKTLLERLEAWISRLAARNNFWHGVTSLIWLPFAARSGIKMYRSKEGNAFSAVLPFKRFNRNWYNAMAGAALLGNAEIAGGMYVFGVCGGDYTVVCKQLDYKFLRPCFGPAVYKINPRDDVSALVAKGGEFNFTCEMDVCQQIVKPGEREKRVGKVLVTFHVTPKEHHKTKRERVRSEAKRT